MPGAQPQPLPAVPVVRLLETAHMSPTKTEKVIAIILIIATVAFIAAVGS